MEETAATKGASLSGITRLRRLNFWVLIGITVLALPIYALLALALLFCDAPGAWCQNSTNINLICIFGVWVPFATWLGLLVGAIRKRPWRIAVWAGGGFLLLMVGTVAWLIVLAAFF